MNLDMFKTSGAPLTEEEEHFLKEARDNLKVSGLTKSELSKPTHELNKITIEMYSIKHAERNTNNLIACNEMLAESNDGHARAMRWLTLALVVVGAIHAFLAMLPTPFSRTIF